MTVVELAQLQNSLQETLQRIQSETPPTLSLAREIREAEILVIRRLYGIALACIGADEHADVARKCISGCYENLAHDLRDRLTSLKADARLILTDLENQLAPLTSADQLNRMISSVQHKVMTQNILYDLNTSSQAANMICERDTGQRSALALVGSEMIEEIMSGLRSAARACQEGREPLEATKTQLRHIHTMVLRWLAWSSVRHNEAEQIRNSQQPLHMPVTVATEAAAHAILMLARRVTRLQHALASYCLHRGRVARQNQLSTACMRMPH